MKKPVILKDEETGEIFGAMYDPDKPEILQDKDLVRDPFKKLKDALLPGCIQELKEHFKKMDEFNTL